MVSKYIGLTNGKQRGAYKYEVLYHNGINADIYWRLVRYFHNRGVCIEGSPPNRMGIFQNSAQYHRLDDYIAHFGGATVKVGFNRTEMWLKSKTDGLVLVEIVSNDSIDDVISRVKTKFPQLKVLSRSKMPYKPRICRYLYKYLSK